MTLPFLLATVPISEDTGVALGLIITLGGAILLAAGAWAVTRHQVAQLELRSGEQAKELQALAARCALLEGQQIRTDERLDRIFEALGRIERVLEDLQRSSHQQHERKSA